MMRIMEENMMIRSVFFLGLMTAALSAGPRRTAVAKSLGPVDKSVHYFER